MLKEFQEGAAAVGDNDCTFCKIAEKETEADIVLEDDAVLAFHDIRRRSPRSSGWPGAGTPSGSTTVPMPGRRSSTFTCTRWADSG